MARQAIFFLIRREDLRDRFIHLMGKGHVTLTVVLELLSKNVMEPWLLPLSGTRDKGD